MNWAIPGKVTLFVYCSLTLSALYWTVACRVYTLHHVADSLPPSLPVSQSLCLSILGKVLLFVSSHIHFEILGVIFPSCCCFFFLLFPSFFFFFKSCFSTNTLSTFSSFFLFSQLWFPHTQLSLPHTHFFTYICSWWCHSSPNISFSLISFPLLPRYVSSVFYGLIVARNTARDKCVWSNTTGVAGSYVADSQNVSRLKFNKKLNQIKLL